MHTWDCGTFRSLVLITLMKVIAVTMLAFRKGVPWNLSFMWLKAQPACHRVELVARMCMGKVWGPVLALVQPRSFGQRTAGEGTHFSYQFCIFGVCCPLENSIFCYFLLAFNMGLVHYSEYTCIYFFWKVNSLDFLAIDVSKHLANSVFLSGFLLSVLFPRLA